MPVFRRSPPVPALDRCIVGRGDARCPEPRAERSAVCHKHARIHETASTAYVEGLVRRALERTAREHLSPRTGRRT